jgi:hypothetical protein
MLYNLLLVNDIVGNIYIGHIFIATDTDNFKLTMSYLSTYLHVK